MMLMAAKIALNVNGRDEALKTDPHRPLLDVLREDLKLIGSKYGCGEGKCGACSILIDGRRAFSCLTPVSDAIGNKVLTIEGLSSGEQLHPVQKAFLEE